MISAQYDQLERQKTALVREVYPLLNQKSGNTLTLQKVMHVFRTTPLWQCCDAAWFVDDFVKTGLVYPLLENPREVRYLRTPLSLVHSLGDKILCQAVQEKLAFVSFYDSFGEKQHCKNLIDQLDKLGFCSSYNLDVFSPLQLIDTPLAGELAKLSFVVQKDDSEAGKCYFRFQNSAYRTMFHARYLLRNDLTETFLTKLTTADSLLAHGDVMSAYASLAFGSGNTLQDNGRSCITHMFTVFETEFPNTYAVAKKFAQFVEDAERDPFFFDKKENFNCPSFLENDKKKLYEFCFLILVCANESKYMTLGQDRLIEALMCMCCHYATHNDPKELVNLSSLHYMRQRAFTAIIAMLSSTTHQYAALKLLHLMAEPDQLNKRYLENLKSILTGESNEETKELAREIIRHFILMLVRNVDKVHFLKWVPEQLSELVDSDQFKQDLRRTLDEIPEELKSNRPDYNKYISKLFHL